MPADSAIIWDFPLAGWDTTQAYRAQAQKTTPDCLNVLPYEPISGRRRGGSRPGTSRVFTTALSGGTFPVQYLNEFTVVADIQANTYYFSEDFLYADAALFNVTTGGNNVWRVTKNSSGGAHTYKALDSGTNLSVTSKALVLTGNDGFQRCGSLLCDPVTGGAIGSPATLGSTWIYRATVTFSAVTTNQTYFTLMGRMLATSPTLIPTAITRAANVVTVTVNNTFAPGDTVTIANCADVSFNAPLTVATASATQYTAAQTAANATPSVTNVWLAKGNLNDDSRLGLTLVYTSKWQLQIYGLNGATLATTDLSAGTTAPAAGVPVVMEMRVDGINVAGYLNGVLLVSTTCGDFLSDTGFGFYLNMPPVGTIKVTDLSVVTGTHQVRYRQVDLVAVCGGSIYAGDMNAIHLLSGGNNVLSSTFPISIGFLPPRGYAVDGTNIIQFNLQTKLVEPYIVSAGTAPTQCMLACMWRTRLILAADRNFPSNLYMARFGDPTNWDTGVNDAKRSIAFSSFGAGGVLGDAIIALCPFSDDILIIFCDHSIFALNGDPGLSTNLDVVSDSMGGLGPECWTKDPSGVLYFCGTMGFFRMVVGGKPECISNQVVNEYFRTINRSLFNVIARWDRDRWGCHIFVTAISSGASTHLFWDARDGGFWRIRFPDDYGPISSTVYDADDPTDRVLLMGGRTGYIYQFDDTVDHDYGPLGGGGFGNVAISSYIVLGPFIPVDDLHETKVFAIQAYLSEKQGTHINRLDWTLQAAKDAFGSLDGSADVSIGGSWIDLYGRRASDSSARARGLAFSLKCANTTIDRRFSFERIMLPFTQGSVIRT